MSKKKKKNKKDKKNLPLEQHYKTRVPLSYLYDFSEFLGLSKEEYAALPSNNPSTPGLQPQLKH